MTAPASAGLPCIVKNTLNGVAYVAIFEQYDGTYYRVLAFDGSGHPFSLAVTAADIWTIADGTAPTPVHWYEPAIGGYSGGHNVTKVNLSTSPPGLGEGD